MLRMPLDTFLLKIRDAGGAKCEGDGQPATMVCGGD
jgi:hypothetical protein